MTTFNSDAASIGQLMSATAKQGFAQEPSPWTKMSWGVFCFLLEVALVGLALLAAGVASPLAKAIAIVFAVNFSFTLISSLLVIALLVKSFGGVERTKELWVAMTQRSDTLA